MRTSEVRARHDWAIVLAGGSGTRLACVAKDAQGCPVPKQYCSLRGGNSLLGDALARARRLVPRERVVVVVAAEHRRFWEHDLGDHPRTNLILQPENRGTAPGILLPLLWVLARDPLARIVVVPSDHFVAREEVLTRTLREALASVKVGPGSVELMGIEPDADEPGLGWILPGQGTGPTHSVHAFVEKPETAAAIELRSRGALWNSFLVAARGSSLIGLYQTRLPALLDAFLREAPHVHPMNARTIYRVLATTDFAQDLLAGSERFLRVRPVPACGWTDLGTVERVVECLHRHRQRSRAPAGAALDLATVLGA